ncbi:AraC family transcriptional regulator [Parabacteroides timonensis]|uniref:AraC family transcriptional regulator n=1 Tax=Parabacteroides timonensis TaxID=1871013 RepID=UPI0009E1ACBA|nr:AraC family transcriptional regulator [Parabacteroides timonensis]
MRNKDISRLILDMKRHDIDVFDEFGRYNYVNAQTNLLPHNHPDMLEICFLAKGSQEYFVGEKTFKLYGGDVFITFPNEIHGTGNVPEEKGILYWMILKSPEKSKEYLGLSFSEAQELFNRILQLPSRLFKGDVECERLLQRIIRIYFQNRDTLTKMELNNQLVSFLLHIIHSGEKKQTRFYSERITEIIQYIDDNLFDMLDLELLADKCSLSLSRFKHLFKEETGIPPAEYIIRKKVEKAQILIEEQELPIKNIAYDLGFSSPAYFSTVFKQYNGYSPTSHKKATDKI